MTQSDLTKERVLEFWFERVVRRLSFRDYLEFSHALVVVTDLLTDLDITDTDALDYLESELRRPHPEAHDICFVPVGRAPMRAR